MEATINEETLQSLIQEVEAFPPTAPTGYMRREIMERGYYEEAGVKFDQDDLLLGQLYSGLAVLARDMDQYLRKHPREDAALFQDVVSIVHEVDQKQYGLQAFPNYEGLPAGNLPTQLASAAALGQPVIASLGARDIVHEWTFKPGKRLLIAFLKEFGTKFKDTICGDGGPYKLFEKNLLKQADLPIAIVSAVLVSGFTPATFWYPLAVYIGLLLVKTGLKTYCED